MSKLVSDLIEEIQSIDEIEEDFELFLMSIKFDETGEVISDESTEPVSRIEIDTENQECLFHITSNGKALSVAEVKKEISSIKSDYLLCASQEQTNNDSSLRIDNPIIGFGENIDLKRFFVVCEA